MGLHSERIVWKALFIGSAVDLQERLAEHRRGHTHTTKRIGNHLDVAASKEVATLKEARKMERTLKEKESASSDLPFAAVEQPRKLSGLVGSSILPPGTFIKWHGFTF